MPFNDNPGLKYLNLLKIGVLELAWLQDEYAEQLRLRVLADMAEPGFLARYHGNSPHPDFGWDLYDRDNDGVLRLRLAATDPTHTLDPRDQQGYPSRIAAVDPDGNWLEIPAVHDFDVALSVPDDGVWRTVRVSRSLTRFHPGTISVTTSSNVVLGTNTKFTRLIGQSDPANPAARGMLLRIDPAETSNGNEGTIEIDEIVSDTELRLTSAVPGTTESGIRFRIAGEFLGGTPADPDIHRTYEPVFSIPNRVIGTKAPAPDLICFDVMRDTGVQPGAFIVDRRYAQLYRSISRLEPQARGIQLTPQGEHDAWLGSGGFELNIRYRPSWSTFLSGSGATSGVSVARYSDSPNLLGVVGDELGNLESWKHPVRQQTRNLDVVESPVQVDASGTAFGPDVERMPLYAAGFTHMVVYAKTGTINMRTTPDNGATWSGETVIWNAPLVDASDAVDQPRILLTRDWRIIIIASYFDNSAGYRTLRTIWSDDFGTTWSTNSNQGTIVIDDTINNDDAEKPSIAQDDDGNIFVAYQLSDTKPASAPAGQGAQTNTIRVFRGENANSVVPGGADADVVTAGYVGDEVQVLNDWLNSSVALYTVQHPALWVGPSGELCVFYGWTVDNGFGGDVQHFILASTAQWRSSQAKPVNTTHIRRQQDQPNPTVLSWAGYVIHGDDGMLHLFHRAIKAGLDGTDWTPVTAAVTAIPIRQSQNNPV